MEGGIAVLLILIILAMAGFAAASGGGGAVLAKLRSDRRDADDRGGGPRHVVAEPGDEQAVGYGVGGEHGDHPRPAELDR